MNDTELGLTAEQELAAELEYARRTLIDARNELCLRCGDYRNSHLGACTGCRWETEWRKAIGEK